jgi:hypothetical protein
VDNLGDLKVIEFISLAPLLIEIEPLDYWIDGNPGFSIGVCDLLIGYPEIERKLEKAEFFYQDQFSTLSLESLSKRVGLTDLEVQDLSQVLQNNKISLPAIGDLTPNELRKKQKEESVSEIKLIHKLSESGSGQASLILAKLSAIYLVDGDEVGYYAKAILQGSTQAANDLAVTLYNKKDHLRKTFEKIFDLLESSVDAIEESTRNLEVSKKSFNICFKSE